MTKKKKDNEAVLQNFLTQYMATNHLKKLALKTRFPLFFFFFWLLYTVPTAYGTFQGMGQIRAATDSLHHSHSNARSELRLQHKPQLTQCSILITMIKAGMEPSSLGLNLLAKTGTACL